MSGGSVEKGYQLAKHVVGGGSCGKPKNKNSLFAGDFMFEPSSVIKEKEQLRTRTLIWIKLYEMSVSSNEVHPKGSPMSKRGVQQGGSSSVGLIHYSVHARRRRTQGYTRTHRPKEDPILRVIRRKTELSSHQYYQSS